MGAMVALAIAYAARRKALLTTGGAVTAVELGALATMAGWAYGAMLILFFVTSVALSVWRRSEKQRLTADTIAKQGARDSMQVGTNGVVFTACALAHLFTGSVGWAAAALGALAAATADTWSTEIGTAMRTVPRSILTMRPVAPGMSGGVTLGGTLAALGGAAFIAGVAMMGGLPRAAVFAAVGAGFAGAMVDSVLGASLQSQRWCPRCKVATERTLHRCGELTVHQRGMQWMDNDTVNFLATIGGAAIGMALA